MKKYIIVNNESNEKKGFTDRYEFEQFIMDNIDLWNDYNDMLDDICIVEISSFNYSPSYVFEKVDPIAYKIGYSEYMDSIIADLMESIEAGEEEDLNEYTLYIEG